MAFLFGKKTAVSAAELGEILGRTRDVQVIDVRETHEYRSGHVPGARPIPLGKLPGSVRDLDPSRPTYVICQTGSRSAAATRLLQRSGFAEVYNVRGGTLAWQMMGGRLVRGTTSG